MSDPIGLLREFAQKRACPWWRASIVRIGKRIFLEIPTDLAHFILQQGLRRKGVTCQMNGSVEMLSIVFGEMLGAKDMTRTSSTRKTAMRMVDGKFYIDLKGLVLTEMGVTIAAARSGLSVFLFPIPTSKYKRRPKVELLSAVAANDGEGASS